MSCPDKKMKTVVGRDVSALLNPRLAILVTCCGLSGKRNLLTVAWHTPLSHEPPCLGIAISPKRYSHQMIVESGEFVVNILGQSMQSKVKFCGHYSGVDTEKFDCLKLKTEQAKIVSPPVLTEALGYLECVLIDKKSIGDHTLFVGQVVHAQVNQDSFSNAWEGSVFGDSPLLCLQRQRYGVCVE
ncbi:NADH-FMN oxidoreductase RutF, flavin reductase (DIM6/NTAB) family [Desulfuromusa kysingii]|uniref:NADH-FMN oxidoreductase RutF, flavin reductase (DIM6/NTAB) family n=2 Tax=Desulfuromusa kysingii TaxID=37625 RepID=A0A1H4A1S6_9BACT|nr:NADH-FMN oxidoreductase RutF, flavin reductase (DIM6/NTAB) family [Desulfuromusa kysingii]